VFHCGHTDGQTFLPGLLGHLLGDDLKKKDNIVEMQTTQDTTKHKSLDNITKQASINEGIFIQS